MRLWFQETVVFWVFGFVSAQLQGFQTCAFAKASPKTKNPRCPSLPLFCQRSKLLIGDIPAPQDLTQATQGSAAMVKNETHNPATVNHRSTHLLPLVPPSALGTLAVVHPVSARFSQELKGLAQHFADRPTRLAEILAATQGRGIYLLLLLIGLTSLTPIPLPGLSSVFGFIVLAIGTRLALGQVPWLPEKLLHRELPARFIARVLAAASRLVWWLEFLLRPRLDFLHEQWIYRRIAGALIMLSGLLWLLPLPVPLSNSFPALTVVLLAAGAMERDGLFFLAGCAAFAATLAYFGLLAVGGAHALDNLWHRVFGL